MTPIEEISTPTPLHGVLTKLRGYERYAQAHNVSAEAPQQDENPVISQSLSLIEKLRLKKPGEGAGKPLSPLEEFRKQWEDLRAEAAKESGGNTEVQQKETDESITRLQTYAKKEGFVRMQIDSLETQLQQIEEAAAMDPDSMDISTIDVQRALSDTLIQLCAIQNESLPYMDPESFMAHNLLKLRQYKRELNGPEGVATTDSIRALDTEIRKKLLETGLVALVGETGTGKTKRARRIAREIYEKFNGEVPEEEEGYRFVRGHKFLAREDLISYLGYSATSMTPEDAMKAYEKWEVENQGAEPEQKEFVRKVIVEKSGSELQLQEFLGPILEARDKGIPVIIDEFNYIDAGLLAAINDVKADPSKPGFCIIFTGNISLAVAKGRYTERRDIDAAWLNRMNSGLMEYNTPPQDDVDSGYETAQVDEQKRKEGIKAPRRELFQIGLATLVDDKGNLLAPEGALHDLWALTEAFKVFQNNFAGKELRTVDKFEGTHALQLKISHASMRTYTEIIKSWKGDGFKYPLEYYLYEKLIRPASVIAPIEASYFYDILRRKYSFFDRDQAWQGKFDVNPTTKALGISGAIRKEEVERQLKLKVFSAQEVAEAFSGYKGPTEITKLKATAEEATTAVKKLRPAEARRIAAEMQGKIDEIKTFTEQFKHTLELFCMDEAAIMGPPQQAA